MNEGSVQEDKASDQVHIKKQILKSGFLSFQKDLIQKTTSTLIFLIWFKPE